MARRRDGASNKPIWHTGNYQAPRKDPKPQLSMRTKEALLNRKGPPSADELIMILQMANDRLPNGRRGGNSSTGTKMFIDGFATMDEKRLA